MFLVIKCDVRSFAVDIVVLMWLLWFFDIMHMWPGGNCYSDWYNFCVEDKIWCVRVEPEYTFQCMRQAYSIVAVE